MMRRTLLAAVICAMAPGLHAEVADSSPNGFTVKITVQVQSPPAEVYRRMVHNVGDWWNSAHTFSGSAHNLSIDATAGGCFCEKLPDAGSVRHMQVVLARPGQALLMTGALGPLQSMAATGTMRFQFTAQDHGTKLELTYSVAGYLPAGMNTWAAPVDSMLREQVGRLKNYVERGDPAPK